MRQYTVTVKLLGPLVAPAWRIVTSKQTFRHYEISSKTRRIDSLPQRQCTQVDIKVNLEK